MKDDRPEIFISDERAKLLYEGKDVEMTQNGKKIRLVRKSGCCATLRAFYKTREGKRIVPMYKGCPYCFKPIPEGMYGSNGTTIKVHKYAGGKRIRMKDGTIKCFTAAQIKASEFAPQMPEDKEGKKEDMFGPDVAPKVIVEKGVMYEKVGSGS